VVGYLTLLWFGKLTRGADVLRPGIGEDFFSSGNPFGVLDVDGDQDVPVLDLYLVAFGFKLRDAQKNGCARSGMAANKLATPTTKLSLSSAVSLSAFPRHREQHESGCREEAQFVWLYDCVVNAARLDVGQERRVLWSRPLGLRWSATCEHYEPVPQT
jgi:hypothetical protein